MFTVFTNNAMFILAIVSAVPALVALLTARPWLAARIRKMEYHERRLALIGAILADHRSAFGPDEIAALQNEVKFIAGEVLGSSLRFEQDRVLNWNGQKLWRRFLTVPRPESAGDWISAVTFYFYLGMGIMYIVLMWPLSLLNPQELSPFFVLTATIAGFGIAALARRWNLWRATSRIVAARARTVAAQGTFRTLP